MENFNGSLSLSGAIKGAFSFSLFVVMAHTHTRPKVT